MEENTYFSVRSKTKKHRKMKVSELHKKIDIAMGCCLLKCISDYKF